MSNSQQGEVVGESADGSAARRGTSRATTPTTPPTLSPRDVMLLDFLGKYDADCPVCGYNLKGLTRPVCPECAQRLSLTVGATGMRMAWLFVALAPGFFSGIAACFVMVPLVGRMFFGDGVFSPGLFAVDLFGWCSGAFAIYLAFWGRLAFLAQPRARQRWFVLIIWFIHIGAFGMLLLGARYL